MLLLIALLSDRFAELLLHISPASWLPSHLVEREDHIKSLNKSKCFLIVGRKNIKCCGVLDINELLGSLQLEYWCLSPLELLFHFQIDQSFLLLCQVLDIQLRCDV